MQILQTQSEPVRDLMLLIQLPKVRFILHFQVLKQLRSLGFDLGLQGGPISPLCPRAPISIENLNQHIVFTPLDWMKDPVKERMGEDSTQREQEDLFLLQLSLGSLPSSMVFSF